MKYLLLRWLCLAAGIGILSASGAEWWSLIAVPLFSLHGVFSMKGRQK